MPEITVYYDFKVNCEKCWNDLKAKLNTRTHVLLVEPCETCLTDAYNEGADAEE